MTKTAADALLWPFEKDMLAPPAPEARILYAGAQVTPAFSALSRTGDWNLVQHYRPHAADLEQFGHRVTPDWPTDGGYDHALVQGTKQTEETRGMLARAALSLKQGGWLVAASGNDEGGRRLEKEFHALGFETESESKYHARIVWGRREQGLNTDAAQRWIHDSALREVPATGFTSGPGLFAWDRIDKGSALLTAHLPRKLTGIGADLGCSYGYLSRHVLDAHPGIRLIHCVDADARAIAACRVNLAAMGDRAAFHWADVTKPVAGLRNLDWVVMNPPFHEGKAVKTATGAAFINAAGAMMRRGGKLYMVANNQLPYESVFAEHFTNVEKLFEAEGYKIYSAQKKG